MRKETMVARLSCAVDVSVWSQPVGVVQYENPTPAGASMKRLLDTLFLMRGEVAGGSRVRRAARGQLD